jgi:hypothetical protein
VAAAHTTRASMNVWRETFPQYVMSCGGVVPWPTHLPDLSRVGYFLWGCL